MPSRIYDDDRDDWEGGALGKRDCTGETCMGGCNCFDAGYDEGKDTATWEANDEHDRELIEGLWRGVTHEINRTIAPLEGKEIFHGDLSSAQTVALLKDFIARLRPLFD